MKRLWRLKISLDYVWFYLQFLYTVLVTMRRIIEKLLSDDVESKKGK